MRILRPDFRTSHTSAWNPGSRASIISTEEFKSLTNSCKWVSFSRRGCSSSPENSTSNIAAGFPFKNWSIAGRKTGFSLARSIIVLSTSSTADASSWTMPGTISIAERSVGKRQIPRTRCNGIDCRGNLIF